MTRKYIKMVFPILPPTSNHIYFRGTILTSVARKYAEDFAKYAAQHHLHEINEMNPKGVFALHLDFFFDKLENQTWFDATEQERTQGYVTRKVTVVENGVKKKELKQVPLLRYRRLDLDNRVKLIQDCVRDALDIDDSQVFASSQEKHQDPGKERVEIVVQELSNGKQFGLSS